MSTAILDSHAPPVTGSVYNGTMLTIIFDLDGTLIDTQSILFPIFREVIRHFPNQPQPSEAVVQKTLGNPDAVIWQMLMPQATEAQRVEAFALYEDIMRQKFQSQEFLIPGVREMLEQLQRSGYPLTIASNCGNDYLNTVLDTLDLRRFFTNPLCLESVGGLEKADILAEHLKHFTKDTAVMVGDRNTDIEAAAAHGIPAIACAFGFGSHDEFQGAYRIIHTPAELPGVLAELQDDALETHTFE